MGHPDYLELFRRPLEKYMAPPPIKVEAPDTVQSEFYHVGEGVSVHLVNHTYNQRILHAPTGPSKQSTPGFSPTYMVHPARTVIPVENVEITVSEELLGTLDIQAVDVLSGEQLSIARDGNKARIKVPVLQEYRLIHIRPRR